MPANFEKNGVIASGRLKRCVHAKRLRIETLRKLFIFTYYFFPLVLRRRYIYRINNFNRFALHCANKKIYFIHLTI